MESRPRIEERRIKSLIESVKSDLIEIVNSDDVKVHEGDKREAKFIHFKLGQTPIDPVDLRIGIEYLEHRRQRYGIRQDSGQKYRT